MNATMTSEIKKHYPVMLNQVLNIISPQHGGMFIDCTFGGGGYSREILKFPNTKILAIDRDKKSKKYASWLSKEYSGRIKFFESKFSNLNNLIDSDISPNAIIFDLGLSSLQLKDLSRGFSFNSTGPLDMKMGINKYSVYDAVNKLSKDDLTSIIKKLGEEKDGRKIANQIIKYRFNKEIENTDELVSIIKKTKRNYQKFKKNPATKTFQALRIFINNELTELVKGLFSATKILKDGGIIIVVSFHSLEDSLVKNFFKFYSSLNNKPSRYLPELKSTKKFNLFKQVSKKALTPDLREIYENNNSRSAKLRYAVRNNNSFYYSNEIEKKFEEYLKIEALKI